MTGLGALAAGVAFLVAAGVSLTASGVVVSRLERVAGRIGLEEAALGLLVALAADTPEVTSAVAALLQGHADIGAGVVLGSNVFNLAALLGLAAVVAGAVRLHRRVAAFDGAAAGWVALVCVVVLATPLGPAAGLGLVAVGVGPYVALSTLPAPALRALRVPEAAVVWCRRAAEEEASELRAALDPTPYSPRDPAVAVVAVLLVVAASTVMERTAQSLGARWHLSGLVVGGVVLAAVTSLPNAVGAIHLARRGRGAAVLSEALNSNMINVVAGLFVPGVIVGLGHLGDDGALLAGWYAGLTALSVALAWGGGGLRRPAGMAIVAGYLGFVAVVVAR